MSFFDDDPDMKERLERGRNLSKLGQSDEFAKLSQEAEQVIAEAAEEIEALYGNHSVPLLTGLVIRPHDVDDATVVTLTFTGDHSFQITADREAVVNYVFPPAKVVLSS